MFSLSSTVGYAIRALACLEAGNCPTRYVRDIARCSQVPQAYLAKIFARLVRAGLLVSKRGVCGGTSLARPATEITLLQIVEAVEGPVETPSCLIGMQQCGDECACPAHEFWKPIRHIIAERFSRLTLAEIIEFERRKSPAKRRARKKNSCHEC